MIFNGLGYLRKNWNKLSIEYQSYPNSRELGAPKPKNICNVTALVKSHSILEMCNNSCHLGSVCVLLCHWLTQEPLGGAYSYLCPAIGCVQMLPYNKIVGVV